MTFVTVGLYAVIVFVLMGIYYTAKEEFKISDETIFEILAIVIAGGIVDKILKMIC